MSDFKGVPTDKLQAEYDAGIDLIRAQRAKLEPLKQELSRRSNARVLVLNQVMAGHAAALRAAGVPEEAVAEAEAHFAAEKKRKHELRVANAKPTTEASTVEGGAA